MRSLGSAPTGKVRFNTICCKNAIWSEVLVAFYVLLSYRSYLVPGSAMQSRNSNSERNSASWAWRAGLWLVWGAEVRTWFHLISKYPASFTKHPRGLTSISQWSDQTELNCLHWRLGADCQTVRSIGGCRRIGSQEADGVIAERWQRPQQVTIIITSSDGGQLK